MHPGGAGLVPIGGQIGQTSPRPLLTQVATTNGTYQVVFIYLDVCWGQTWRRPLAHVFRRCTTEKQRLIPEAPKQTPQLWATPPFFYSKYGRVLFLCQQTGQQPAAELVYSHLPGSAPPTLRSNHIVCIETSRDIEVNNNICTKTEHRFN